MKEAIEYHVLTAQTASLLADADIFDGPVKPEELARFVAEEGHLMVFATDGRRPVGFASGAVLMHPDKAPMFFISEVGVNESWQRRGIATRLCQTLMEMARDCGIEGIWLATEDDNDAARALYRALGAGETTGVVVYDWGGVMGPP